MYFPLLGEFQEAVFPNWLHFDFLVVKLKTCALRRVVFFVSQLHQRSIKLGHLSATVRSFVKHLPFLDVLIVVIVSCVEITRWLVTSHQIRTLHSISFDCCRSNTKLNTVYPHDLSKVPGTADVRYWTEGIPWIAYLIIPKSIKSSGKLQ